MKAVWTPELAQDLNAYHSVDAEAELTAMLSEYIAMEIDLEILDMLSLNASAKTAYWSAKVGFEYDGSGTESDFGHRLVVLQMHTQKHLGSKLLELRYNQYLTQFIRRHFVVVLILLLFHLKLLQS